MPLFPSPSENPGSYNATLWALQNPWFRDCSEPAGALGGQEPGAPTSRPIYPSSGVSEGHREHVRAPVPFGGFGRSPGHHTPKVMVRDVRQASVLESDSSDRVPKDSHGWGDVDETFGGNVKDCDPWTVADLRGEEAIFCRVGKCRYWHTDSRQVKRHQNSHFEDRYGFVCPNQTTCPSRGGDFRRRDAVSVHCKRSPLCGDALEANNGTIGLWGTPATEGDLQPYDPKFHIPYERFDGRNRRGGGKVTKTC